MARNGQSAVTSIGNPAACHASNPPSMSEARANPRSRERRGGDARRVAIGADEDDLSVRIRETRVLGSGRGVESPVQHRQRLVNRARDDARLTRLLRAACVDDDRAVSRGREGSMRGEPIDPRARGREKVVHRPPVRHRCALLLSPDCRMLGQGTSLGASDPAAERSAGDGSTLADTGSETAQTMNEAIWAGAATWVACSRARLGRSRRRPSAPVLRVRGRSGRPAVSRGRRGPSSPGRGWRGCRGPARCPGRTG